MARVWHSLVRREKSPVVKRSLSVDELIAKFQSSPLLQTSYGSGLDVESPINSPVGAYSGSGPIFALVMARMQVFSQARLQWTRFSGGKPTDLFGTPELGLFERPWAGGTTADLLARMEMHISLCGNAFVRRTGNRLVLLNPAWVGIVMGSKEDAANPALAADTEVLGYVYLPPGHGRKAQHFLPDEVAHYAPIPHPDLRFIGMSWITPLIQDVIADDMQTRHKRKFLENGATPNLAIKFDPNVPVEKVKAFKEIIEDEYTGIDNAWKTLYIGGGADPVVIGKDFQQLDFAATQGKGEARLAAAAGVPPSWVGFSEGLQGSSLNSGNFSSARRRFSDGTMVHLWVNACASLERLLTPPPGASLWYDTSAVAFMREDAKDAADVQSTEGITITTLVREGFTAASAIDAVVNSDWSRLQHSGLVSVQMQEIAPPKPSSPST